MSEKKAFRQMVTAEQLRDVTRTQLRAQPAGQQEGDPLVCFTLRLRRSLVEAIDAAAAERPGAVSRTTWIAEAVAAQLARGPKAEPER